MKKYLLTFLISLIILSCNQPKEVRKVREYILSIEKGYELISVSESKYFTSVLIRNIETKEYKYNSYYLVWGKDVREIELRQIIKFKMEEIK